MKFYAARHKIRFVIVANKGMSLTRLEGSTRMNFPANRLESILTFDLIIPSLAAPNGKQLLYAAAKTISEKIGISVRILADRFKDAERNSPFTMGEGIAIMHLQISGLQHAMSVFIRLKNPVPMDAPDNMDVDLVCVLLTPAREGSAYLRTLARLSRLLRNPQIRARLRAASDEKTIRMILEQSSISLMAA